MITIANQLYISAELAKMNGVCTEKYKKQKAWDFISLGTASSDQFIRRSALSKYDRKAVGSIQSIKEQIGLQNLLKKKEAAKLRLRIIENKIRECKKSANDQFAYLYQDIGRTPKEVVKYCQEHALLSLIFELVREKRFKQTEIAKVLESIEHDKFGTKQSLSRKLNEIKFFESNHSIDESIKICIVSKSRGVERPHRQKVSEWHKLWIFYFYCKKNFNYPDILKLVNRICDRYGKNRLKLYSIKRELNSNYVKNLFGLERYGYEWLKSRLIPYVDKLKPPGFLTILQIDGSRLQLPYYDHVKKRVDFLTIFVLLDVATSKVVGYWLDNHENRFQILNAFYRYFNVYRYLPKLIIHDGSRSFLTDEFKLFKERAIQLGVAFRRHLPNNPNEKGNVERFFTVFCERICKFFPEYTGLSLVARDPNVRPNRKKVMSILKCKSKLKTRQELILAVDSMITQYNQLNINDKDSPDQKETKKDIDAISLSESDLALLTWKTKSDRSVSRSEVKFYYQGFPYKYKIKDLKNILNFNGSEIHFAWNPSNLDHIFIYDKEYKFLEKCFLKKSHQDDISRLTNEEAQKEFYKEVNGNKKVLKSIQAEIHETMDKIESSFTVDDYTLSFYNSDKEEATLIQNQYTRQYYDLKEDHEAVEIDDFDTEESSQKILAHIDELNHEEDI